MIIGMSVSYGDATTTKHTIAIDDDRLVFEDCKFQLELSLLNDLIKALNMLADNLNDMNEE